jgi:hypothetical protein
MSVCCECWVFPGKRSSRRNDHSPRGVLPNVERLHVVVKPRYCRGPGPAEAVKPYKKSFIGVILGPIEIFSSRNVVGFIIQGVSKRDLQL